MARFQCRWESLPPEFRDIGAFMPVVSQVLMRRFPPAGGHTHVLIGRGEYRVRKGLLQGWDVRVWRQEELTIDVRRSAAVFSALPVLAGILAFGGNTLLEKVGLRFGDPSGTASRQMGLLAMAVWTVFFLVFWGLLGLLAGPLVRRDGGDEEILTEIRRELPPFPGAGAG